MSTLVVLAGGLGTRYGGDKQLEAVGPSGEALFEYALYDAWRAGCARAVLVIREDLVELLERTVLPPWRGRLEVALAPQRIEQVPRPLAAERHKPWGTAHALLVARAHVRGAVLACNADDYYGAGAFTAVARLLAETAAHGVAGYPLGRTLSPHGGVSRAVCHTDARGALRRIEERTGIVQQKGVLVDDRGETFDQDTPVSMNLWGFQPAFLAGLDAAFATFLDAHEREPEAEFRIPDLVNELVPRGLEVQVVPVADTWFGMTYAADRDAVRAALAARVQAGAYPSDLRAV